MKRIFVIVAVITFLIAMFFVMEKRMVNEKLRYMSWSCKEQALKKLDEFGIQDDEITCKIIHHESAVIMEVSENSAHVFTCQTSGLTGSFFYNCEMGARQ